MGLVARSTRCRSYGPVVAQLTSFYRRAGPTDLRSMDLRVNVFAQHVTSSCRNRPQAIRLLPVPQPLNQSDQDLIASGFVFDGANVLHSAGKIGIGFKADQDGFQPCGQGRHH